MSRILPLDQGHRLPFWRRPEAFLILTAIAMPLSFMTWSALLDNWTIEAIGFTGVEIGNLHMIREIPGFLAVGVIAIILFMREQVLGVVALFGLGVATAMTAWFPSFSGILWVTLLSSIGFHYYETVNQSLQLQWLKKESAPRKLGMLIAVGSAATFVAYMLIMMTWNRLGLGYNTVFMVSGGLTAIIALYCWLAFPQFEAPNPQRKQLILRQRYWLYYALQFMSGARRQIFVVFAGFMMVEHFGYQPDEKVALMLATLMANILFAPMVGRAVGVFGERNALVVEYAGLTLVFLAYGGIYWFGWGVALAAALYIVDHLLFALALSLKTYFQKIADPGDIAPTAAVAFTINHIAAVGLPLPLGYLWVHSPGAVFGLAAAMAVVSLLLSLLIPRRPEPGNETIFAAFRRQVLAD